MSSHKLPQTIRAPLCVILISADKTKIRLTDTRLESTESSWRTPWFRISEPHPMVKHKGKWIPGPEIVALKTKLKAKYRIRKRKTKSPGPRNHDPQDRKFKWQGKVILLKAPKVVRVPVQSIRTE